MMMMMMMMMLPINREYLSQKYGMENDIAVSEEAGTINFRRG